MHHKRTTCRGCGGTRLELFLSLGPTPLANAFLSSPEEFASEPWFPLDVYFCHSCSLVQLCDVVDPEVLFRNYIYVTGTSETIAAHNVRYAETVVHRLGLAADDLVVEVASNDGSLLRCFREAGTSVLGVEPATNIAALAVERGVPTVNRFFDSSTARDVKREHGEAAAVIGNNVFAHVDEPIDFLRGCANLMHADGLVIIEVPYLGELVDRLEYDTIYHEHLCYFSVTALTHLFAAADLRILDVERVPVHGGSLRLYGGSASRHQDHGPIALSMIDDETRQGLNEVTRFRRLAADVAQNRADLLSLLRDLRERGHSIAAYGAPAKGNTLLNYCQIGPELVPWIADKAPLKHGHWTPGTHIPVVPAAELAARQPDYALILAWNFAEEIIDQQGEYRRQGGNFIVPIPHPTIIE